MPMPIGGLVAVAVVQALLDKMGLATTPPLHQMPAVEQAVMEPQVTGSDHPLRCMQAVGVVGLLVQMSIHTLPPTIRVLLTVMEVLVVAGAGNDKMMLRVTQPNQRAELLTRVVEAALERVGRQPPQVVAVRAL